MSVHINDRENAGAFSFEDGRTFDEEGRVEHTDENTAIQPGDVITTDGGKQDLRVIEVSQDGILAHPQSNGVADLSQRPEMVAWDDVELWGDRTQAAQYEHFWANIGPIGRSQNRE